MKTLLLVHGLKAETSPARAVGGFGGSTKSSPQTRRLGSNLHRTRTDHYCPEPGSTTRSQRNVNIRGLLGEAQRNAQQIMQRQLSLIDGCDQRQASSINGCKQHHRLAAHLKRWEARVEELHEQEPRARLQPTRSPFSLFLLNETAFLCFPCSNNKLLRLSKVIHRCHCVFKSVTKFASEARRGNISGRNKPVRPINLKTGSTEHISPYAISFRNFSLLVRLRPLAPDRTSYAQPLIVPPQTPISNTGSPLRRIVSEFSARSCPTKRRSLHVSIQQVNAETAAAGPGLESRVIARPLTWSGRAKRDCCTSKRPASTRLPSASSFLSRFESSFLFICLRSVVERTIQLLGISKLTRKTSPGNT